MHVTPAVFDEVLEEKSVEAEDGRTNARLSLMWSMKDCHLSGQLGVFFVV